MAIALSSIRKENVYAKHSSGAIVTPSSVTDLGGGNYQYKIDRSWATTDTGDWSVFVSSANPVLNDRGVAVVEQKIGSFTVSVSGTSTYFVVVPWASMVDLTAKISALEANIAGMLVESVNPPDATPYWRAWLHREVVNGKIALTYYVRSLVDDAAIGIWSDPNYADFVVVPSHANAVAISDTEFRQNLIQGISLIYTPKRDINGQIGIRLFTSAGTFTSITAIALDATGTAIATWTRTLTDITGEVNQVTPPAQGAKIKLTFVKPDQTSIVYEFPLI